jgi:very-short-patch-repair endonuclease
MMTEYFNRSTEKDKRRNLRNAMPTTEAILWGRLKGRQLLGCKFRRQYSVGAFVLDFYSAENKLGIELDGDSHFQEGKRQYDKDRDSFIGSFGIKIVRFLNADIYDNLDGVLEVIGRAIVERRGGGSTPPGPPLVYGPGTWVTLVRGHR